VFTEQINDDDDDDDELTMIKLMPITHASETGAINRLHFLVPVFRTDH